jgi:putative Mn2+ efflux pump MntP
MELLTIIAIAVGLSMDAFAVSVVTGAAHKELHVRHTLRMAGFFGGFQAFMPAVGYIAGLTVRQYISSFDHWVAFGILAAVGLKMIYESFKIKEERQALHPANLAMLLALAVATSIDALAVGITLSLITHAIAAAIVIIGVVTFGLSCTGVYIGKKFGHFFESGIEAIGGLVLIGLGVKIMLQHVLA